MRQFHQHSDRVFVRTDAGMYIDTQKNFEQDFNVTLPSMPDGCHERIYEPGIRHPIGDGNNVLYGAELQWSLGDQIINKCAEGIAAQKARLSQIPRRAAVPPQGN